MAWLRRLWNTLRPERVQGDIDRELAFHLAERADELRAEGLTDDEARPSGARSIRQRDDPGRTHPACRHRAWLDAMLRNVTYSLRALGRAPGPRDDRRR